VEARQAIDDLDSDTLSEVGSNVTIGAAANLATDVAPVDFRLVNLPLGGQPRARGEEAVAKSKNGACSSRAVHISRAHVAKRLLRKARTVLARHGPST